MGGQRKRATAGTDRRPASPRGCRWTASDTRRFRAGTHPDLYRKLGAHPLTLDGSAGVAFAVWAPNARAVSVIGDFNGWTAGEAPLGPVADSGTWWGFVPGLREGALYKFHISSVHGDYSVDKSDPFAFRRQAPPETASIVAAPSHDWADDAWLAARPLRQGADAPLSIYELHAGSWRRDPESPERLPEWSSLGDALIPYLESTGFTHVELMPLAEHPYYASWGYQTTGYFAATARYGEPDGLMALIDRLHRHGFGVVLDWVPSHFPSDEHGLSFFDGTHLYEYEDPRLGYHQDWKSYVFDYTRPEVRSFLISSALYWIERFHVDALRVDAVASMLYRDYSRAEGQWVPNQHGGRENLEAIGFLRDLNDAVHERYPGVLTIAEESTSWPMVSRPAYLGGLGFDMKWDMGWMHDTLQYMALDPIHRRYHHESITFRMMYAWSENFLLPLSHDEVVHGKKSLLGKMYGDYWQKFANLRALYGYMYGQPGKKLLFMGGEIGQWREWNHDAGIEWELLEYPSHAGLQRWVAALNGLYRARRALHGGDFSPASFEWIDCSDAEQSVLCFLRRSVDFEGQAEAAQDGLVVVCNFTPLPRHNYRIGVPGGGSWREVLNSDAAEYGGSGVGNPDGARAVAMAWHNRPWSICLTLPPLGVLFLERALTAPPAATAPADEP